jgi:hypothetical protein
VQRFSITPPSAQKEKETYLSVCNNSLGKYQSFKNRFSIKNHSPPVLRKPRISTKPTSFPYNIQKTNLNKIQQTKTINIRFIDWFCQFINQFYDSWISFVLQNKLSLSFSIYQFKKKQFPLLKTGHPRKPSRTDFVENHEHQPVFIDK